MPNVTAYNGKMTASFCFHPLKKEELRGANQSSNVPYTSSAPAASIAITVSPKPINTPHFHSTHLKLSAAYIVNLIITKDLIIVMHADFEYFLTIHLLPLYHNKSIFETFYICKLLYNEK